MRSISISAEKQQDAEVVIEKNVATVYVRKDHVEKESEISLEEFDAPETYWECDEAVMQLPAEEAPPVEEILEDFDLWFDYAARWRPSGGKTLAQLQADIEYIAAMTGVDLEV